MQSSGCNTNVNNVNLTKEEGEHGISASTKLQNCPLRKSKIIAIGQTVSGLFGKKLPKQPGQKNHRRERVIGRVMEAVGHHKWKVLLLDKSTVEKSSNSLRIEEKV